jgi:Ca2+-binding RTX toxin-like protein
VRTTDQWGDSFEEQFTVNVNDLEEKDGNPRNNRLGGSASDELFRALGGNDRIYGAGGNDVLDGGDGRDNLYGGDGNDTLYGGRGNDRFYGNAGNDSILGGDGRDFIFGGNGDDLLDGGAGSDRLFGNGGSDTFVLEEGMGRDFIYRFEDGTDSIQLAGGLTFDELEIASTTGYTQIKIADTGEFLAMLPGIDSALIDETDFSTTPL